MRIETEHHVFEIDEPAGREGRELFRSASALIAECGWEPAHADRFIFALAGHPRGEQALIATLGRGTMDDEPFAVRALDKLPIEHSKEPWDALLEAWIRLGFFGSGLLKGFLKAGEMLKAAKETPDSE